MRKIFLSGLMFLMTVGMLTGCFNSGEIEEISSDNPVAENIALDEADAKGQQAVDYLLAEVGEIAEFGQMIEDNNRENGTDNKLIIYINGEPDPLSSDSYRAFYYDIYVGEDLGSHTSRYATFLVQQDLQEILVDDPISGEYISLADWRNQ